MSNIVVRLDDEGYVIKLQKGDTDRVKHYIAQYESAKNDGDCYWMNFSHRTNSAG